MKLKLNADLLKYGASALIVGAAACIIMPGLVGYLAGLWRLGVLIVVVIAIAAALGTISAKFIVARKLQAGTSLAASPEASEAKAEADQARPIS